MLVSTAALAGHLNDPAWVIFDCRHDLVDHAKGARLYREGHISGAHFAPVETALSGPKTGINGRHPLPDPSEFLGFLARHGVSRDSTVVAYDDVGGQYAARLWWLARWVGFPGVLLLDGGLPLWRAENRPLSSDVPVPVPAALVGTPDRAQFWDVAEVQRHLAVSECALIDARAPERYRGETESIDPVAGHIPRALNRFFKLNLNPDLTFRPAADLRSEFSALLQGRTPDHVAHQCGSGITACVNLFAMEYAGLPGSKLYPGSWSEWIADPARPTVPARH